MRAVRQEGTQSNHLRAASSMTLGDFDRGFVLGVAVTLLGVLLGFAWWAADVAFARGLL